jgi:2'-5' RNA ligase
LIRSFLAIELPKTIQKRIEEIQKELVLSRADVRWVDPRNIHLTLKFFGSIEESRVDGIVQSIGDPVKTTLPFPLVVRGMGAFPHIKNPRIIWVGLVDSRGALASFQNRLETALEEVGFEAEDRPFHPHLTLGRTKSSRGKDELVGKMEAHREEGLGDFQVEKVILFKSDLRPSGPVYTPLREMKLGS